jgi:N,N'-diacetyllegionaminate synthase
MKIGDWDLEQRVLVVAEIGNNHEGDYALAEELIALAARAGAGAVKFQTIVPEKLVAAAEVERIRQLERFRLSYEQFEQLSRVARKHGVLFLSTPFDLDSARFLTPLVPAFKIASGDNNFFPLLREVARTGKPIILSTGLLGLDEVRTSKAFIEEVWRTQGLRQELALLHCVVNYPTAPGNANLRALEDLKRLGTTVGYSDHTLGIESAVLSVALGARIIEKHFTISKTYSAFRDHQLSADPVDLAQLVSRVRGAEEMLGHGCTDQRDTEREMVPRVRRSIVAARDLPAGKVLAWEAQVLSRALLRSVRKGEQILPADCRQPGEVAA